MNKKIIRDRNSATKEEILAILKSKQSALSHKQLQELFVEKVDRVTIYRALDRLVLEGKLHKISNFDGVILYALCDVCNHKGHQHHQHDNDNHFNHHHEHVHFCCTKCQEISCLTDILPQFNLPNGYKIEETQVIVSGVCPKCSSI